MALRGFIGVGSGRIQNDAILSRVGESRFFEAPIEQILSSFDTDGVRFHALRTRQSGRRVFISLHVLVPGDWLVKRAHDFSERIEESLCMQFPNANVITHLEPIDDPVSMADEALDRQR
ncbi:hypothetical protein ETQ85_24780 [Zoogloea oleivorans]|uniref:Cation efflux protein cytoplasmic domain-containing protein n=1 Tax=Zoogloea oleivorans TaxID=1552750 RepID=A0A6C2C9Y7_9RHOO|nr:hypothetical protein ETQ85_24780 [Zoogloea oleivorans]